MSDAVWEAVTWNVNSVRVRAAQLRRLLADRRPAVVALQEIKCEDHAFPDFADLGYRAETVGQKSYNGVALLARLPIHVTCRALPGLDGDPPQSRYLEAEIGGITVASLYLPNGNSGGETGLGYKLRWMDALAARARALLETGRPLMLLGDFNVCPAAADLANAALPDGDALVAGPVRDRFSALRWLGLTDALRALHPDAPRLYTFWDYQAGAFARDAGLRIDHAMLSAELAEGLRRAECLKATRAWDQPSDHAPVAIGIDGGRVALDP